jgi:hypothetical protein
MLAQQPSSEQVAFEDSENLGITVQLCSSAAADTGITLRGLRDFFAALTIGWLQPRMHGLMPLCSCTAVPNFGIEAQMFAIVRDAVRPFGKPPLMLLIKTQEPKIAD